MVVEGLPMFSGRIVIAYADPVNTELYWRHACFEVDRIKSSADHR